MSVASGRCWLFALLGFRGRNRKGTGYIDWQRVASRIDWSPQKNFCPELIAASMTVTCLLCADPEFPLGDGPALTVLLTIQLRTAPKVACQLLHNRQLILTALRRRPPSQIGQCLS